MVIFTAKLLAILLRLNFNGFFFFLQCTIFSTNIKKFHYSDLCNLMCIMSNMITVELNLNACIAIFIGNFLQATL